MNQQNYDYLNRFIGDLSFKGHSAQLYSEMMAGEKNFKLCAHKTLGGEHMRYELHFDKSTEQDYYFFNRYTAIRHKHINIRHAEVGDVNTGELEARMDKLNWNALQYKKEPAEDGIAEDVGAILRDLAALTGTPQADQLRTRLEAKYFLGTSYEDAMAHPGTAKDLFTVRQSFPVYHKRADQQPVSQTIDPFEAYHMLCGRPVEKFMVTSKGEQQYPWLQLDFGKKDAYNNYEVTRYGPGYGFDLSKVLERFPFEELKDRDARDRLESSMKQGKTPLVTAMVDDVLQEFYISPNIERKTLHIYNTDHKPIKHEIIKTGRSQSTGSGQPSGQGEATSETVAPSTPEGAKPTTSAPGEPVQLDKKQGQSNTNRQNTGANQTSNRKSHQHKPGH